jgi:hypothetical protein
MVNFNIMQLETASHCYGCISFDSKMDGSVAILTPHTAFTDPTTPKDARHRESIELRALVLLVVSPSGSQLLTDLLVCSYDNLPNGA